MSARSILSGHFAALALACSQSFAAQRDAVKAEYKERREALANLLGRDFTVVQSVNIRNGMPRDAVIAALLAAPQATAPLAAINAEEAPALAAVDAAEAEALEKIKADETAALATLPDENEAG